MKTGHPKDIKKSQLTIKLEHIQAEQEDLMTSHMINFVQSSNDILRNAQHTIKNDMEEFLEITRSLIQQKLQWMQTAFRLAPWIILTTVLISITTMIGISLAWNWQMHRTQMTPYGLTKAVVNDQTYLILNSKRIRLASCTAASKMITCLEVMK